MRKYPVEADEAFTDLAAIKRQQAWARLRRTPRHLLGWIGLLPPPKMRHAAAHWRNDVTYVHAQLQIAVSGVNVFRPPVARFEADSPPAAVGAAVLESLAAYRAWARYPDLRSEAAKALFHDFLQQLDAKTNAQMMKGAKLVSISKDGHVIRLKPWRNAGARRGFEDMPSEVGIELPADASHEAIGEALAEAFARCG